MSVLLYHGRASTCSKKVRIALYEKGVASESHLIDLAEKEQKSPDYLALNPKGIVPTLVNPGNIITESSVIIEYIDDAFDGPPLRPAKAEERAAIKSWIKFSDDVAFPAITGPTWKYMQDRAAASRPPSSPPPSGPPRFSAGDLAAGEVAMEACVATLDRALTGRTWLSGDQFTLADAAVIPFVDRIRNLRADLVTATAAPAMEKWLPTRRVAPFF